MTFNKSFKIEIQIKILIFTYALLNWLSAQIEDTKIWHYSNKKSCKHTLKWINYIWKWWLQLYKSLTLLNRMTSVDKSIKPFKILLTIYLVTIISSQPQTIRKKNNNLQEDLTIKKSNKKETRLFISNIVKHALGRTSSNNLWLHISCFHLQFFHSLFSPY